MPDLNDFVAGMKIVLKPHGVITMEFPHLMRLMEGNQFDTIYHEHFSYFSLLTVEQVFAAHGLTLFDVEEIPTHGGSLRIYARHAEDRRGRSSRRVARAAGRAKSSAGLNRLDTYGAFDEQVKETKRKLLEFLIGAKRERKSVAGYGAPGKGNTLLNYCGIRTDFVDYTVDRNPYKHGKFLPGTHIPIFPPERIRRDAPRLRADSAVEPEGRNHRAARLHPRLGRPVRRADSRSPGVRVMRRSGTHERRTSDAQRRKERRS